MRLQCVKFKIGCHSPARVFVKAFFFFYLAAYIDNNVDKNGHWRMLYALDNWPESETHLALQRDWPTFLQLFPIKRKKNHFFFWSTIQS